MLMLLLALAVLLLRRLAERNAKLPVRETASPSDYQHAKKSSAHSKS